MKKADNIGSTHGFFDCHGGVSSGVYESLNCGLGSKDARDDVIENRSIVAEKLEVDTLITPYQVHGNLCSVILNANDIPVEADGIVTRTPGIAIGILTADCCPILFEDRAAGIVGAAHAGWRGATAGITDSVIQAMLSLGADKSRINAAIGPTIACNSYEVGEDMRDAALAADKGVENHFYSGRDSAHFQFDLPGYVEARLQRAGITDILDLKTDTYRRATHRNEPDYGRFVSAIVAGW